MKYAIKISYDGKNYSGWQEQKDKSTVQAVIEDALAKIFGQKIKIYASGRTDAGVSALGQVAHFSTDEILPKGFVGYINSILPRDIKILGIEEVSGSFNARFDAHRKTYIYKMYLSDFDIPIYEDGALRVPTKINLEKMRKEISSLKGKHDFSSFCASNTAVEDKIRTIYKVSLKKFGDFLEFSITGNGFLYNMVRIIIGTLVDIGLEKDFDMKKIIESKDRKKAGKTAPAKALILKNVEYKGILIK